MVSNFIVQALSGEPITIFGDGLQTRSFCYVDDLVDGLMRMMESPDDVTGPINLGNPGEFTMLQLAEAVIAKTGRDGGIIHRPLPKMTRRDVVPTSRWLERSSAGSLSLTSTRGWTRRSRTSVPCYSSIRARVSDPLATLGLV